MVNVKVLPNDDVLSVIALTTIPICEAIPESAR
jgi:hypothetical protein